MDAGEIYNEMMALYAGRYDLNHLFDRLKTLFGIRLCVVSADDFRYNEKVVGMERMRLPRFWRCCCLRMFMLRYPMLQRVGWE